MAWTAPSDFATSHKVTAAEWNAMNGTSGDMAYLKTYTDATRTVSQSDVTGSRAIDGSVYHNTSGKIMIATITGYGSGSVTFSCDSNASPTTGIGVLASTASATGTFIIPANYYYKAPKSGTYSLSYWIEYTLF